MPTTGEKPGKGTYYCTKCGQAVILDDYTDTLPPCPKCKGTNFRKQLYKYNNDEHGGTIAAMKCSKSPNGKHAWTNSVEQDVLGNKTQFRKCDHCRLKQKHEKNPITGRNEGWQSI